MQNENYFFSPTFSVTDPGEHAVMWIGQEEDSCGQEAATEVP